MAASHRLRFVADCSGACADGVGLWLAGMPMNRRLVRLAKLPDDFLVNMRERIFASSGPRDFLR